MRPNYAIADEDRPYIEFERVRNRGLRARSEKKNKDGKVTRIASPGEVKQPWRKSLIGRVGNGMQEPYVWVTKDWVVSQCKDDCIPVGFGNIDTLPANYPASWRAQLEDAVNAIKGLVAVNVKLREAEKRLAESESRAEARAPKAKKEANGEPKAE